MTNSGAPNGHRGLSLQRRWERAKLIDGTQQNHDYISDPTDRDFIFVRPYTGCDEYRRVRLMKKNWIDKFYLCRANILLISLIIFIQYKQKRGRHRILFRMIKQAIAFHKVKLIEKCIHWIFNLFKWRVKIRYLASLLEVMVLDFQYFGWNLLGPPRTIPYGHWEHLSWSKGAPFSPLIK